LGRIDTNTYPVWWLDSLTLSGDLEADKKSLNVIPLRVIVSGRSGPNMNAHFNLYYLHWWSLAHFLMEGDDGAHRAGLAQMIAAGAGLATFERHIGPIEAVERQWYSHVLDLKRQLAGDSQCRVRITHHCPPRRRKGWCVVRTLQVPRPASEGRGPRVRMTILAVATRGNRRAGCQNGLANGVVLAASAPLSSCDRARL